MRGFTLIELLVVVAIVLVVITMTTALYVGMSDSGTTKTAEFLLKSIVKRARAEALARHATVVVIFQKKSDETLADEDENATVTLVAIFVELGAAPADDIEIASLTLPEGASLACDDFPRNVALAAPPTRPGSPVDAPVADACYIAFNRSGAMVSLTDEDVRNNLRLCVQGERVVQTADLGINPATGIVQSGHLPAPTPTAASAASFVGLDSETRGDWPGNYGASGLVICNYYAGTVVEGDTAAYDLTKTYDYSRLPDYVADYAYTHDNTHAAATSWGAFAWGDEIRHAAGDDRRGLLRPDGARIGSSVLATDPKSIQVAFSLRDDEEHLFSIYATENTPSSRYMTVALEPLDSYGEPTAVAATAQCSAAQYENGVWFRFRVRGSFRVTLKNRADGAFVPNTFVSGFFFDEPPQTE